MPPLHPFSTLPTSADGNVKSPYPRPAHDLFLILRLDPLQGQRTGTRRTLRRNRYRNLFIHTLRDRPTLEFPEFYGLFYDGRLAVIYSPYDLMSGVNRESNAYAKGVASDDALRLVINTITYALSH